MTITATDLFSGFGGATEGLSQAGLDVQICANHNPTAIANHKLNHPLAEHRQASVQDIDWRSFPSTDVLWGSPSCTAQTPAGGRKRPTLGKEMLRSDTRSVDRATAFAIIAAAEVHLYPVVLVENVPEFASWVLYRWWLDGLTMLGYTVQTMILNASDFGHAQHRKRLFIVATQPSVDIDLTVPTFEPVYASDILDDDAYTPVTRKLYVSDQIAQIDPAKPNVPHLVTYRKHAKALRADANQLATVTAGGNHHGLAYLDHSGQPWHRMTSNRECARAQGFPDHYQFEGTKGQVKSGIGTAVPVGIARWLGERSAAALAA